MARIPIVKSLHIENVSGTGINAADYFNKNTILGEYSDGRLYAMQRPSIDIWEDASATLAPDTQKGRGVYFWDDANSWYFVNDDTVYKDSYSSALAQSISSGTRRVYFVELVNYLVILDPANNEGWYIHNGATGTLIQITDIHFPGQASNSDELTTGGVFLDGTLYVGGTSGAIYGSDINDPTSWEALNKISAEREADNGVHIDKHHDHVVMFGTRTIEFFYDAGNPSPVSPLSRRTDIAYNIGLLQGDSVFREGDDIYCIGVQPSGALHAIKLSNFQIENIDTPDIETYITNARLVEQSLLIGAGFTTGDRTYYILTFYRLLGGIITPDVTLVYDSVGWGLWASDLCACGNLPLIAWNIKSGVTAQLGSGILSNGDLIQFNDNFEPQDTLLASSYIADGYINDGYYTSSGSSGNNIDMRVRTGPFDGDTNRWKFMHHLEVVGDETNTEQTALIKWMDGNSFETGLNAGRTIALNRKQKITRLGRFKRRNLEFHYSGDEQYRIEGLDVEITEGGH